MIFTSNEIADNAAERIRALFEGWANENYIGEPVSVQEHSSQAFELARAAGESDDACLACFLHDIGHMLGLEAGFPPGMDGCGTPDHEGIAADFLNNLGFNDTVCYLVRNHVNAKRYLVYKDPNYQLSDASKVTLQFQGGAMTADEAQNAEKDARWPTVLKMRKYDEGAKEVGREVVSMEEIILPLIVNHVREHCAASSSSSSLSSSLSFHKYLLSREQLRYFEENGVLIMRAFPWVRREDLLRLALDLEKLTPGENGVLVHKERTGDKDVLCRVENFTRSHAEWNALSRALGDIAAQLFGESSATLFKDKLNFKGPGGGGFLAHQDVTAYKSADLASTHISVMVAVDDADDPTLGPLEVALARHHEGIFPNEKGVVTPAIEKDMTFTPLMMRSTDIAFFGSFVPHRSARNTTTDRRRRAAYLTYNAASEGDHHASYYKAKLETWQSGKGGTISINDDFSGTIVS